ncbi:hypothetical protein BHM03_00013541 [Ensete ventricosum]|nr:hypothetical protein BHM03_00013541 [Ensete ventricosum]
MKCLQDLSWTAMPNRSQRVLLLKISLQAILKMNLPLPDQLTQRYHFLFHFVIWNFLDSILSDKMLHNQILSQDLLKKYITYAKLNVFPKLHDADLDKFKHVYADIRRESSVRLPGNLVIYMLLYNYRKYMTFKKDFNELLLHLLRILVKDALHFEEIVSGTTARLTHIEFWLGQAQEYEIYDLKPFFSSAHFTSSNFILDESRGVIKHPLAR